MTELANVNFELLVQAHNGDLGRAKLAWEKICQLGRYGAVPHLYHGGLDLQSLRNAVDDNKAEQAAYEVKTRGYSIPGWHDAPRMSPTLEDDIKRIEDLATGDNPE